MYVFDTNSLIELSHFYQDRFPSLWQRVDNYVATGKIVSVREVFREVTNTSDQNAFDAWVENNKNMFLKPTPQEAAFVAEIFATKNFNDLIRKKQILQGLPVADPFVIAAAHHYNYAVVTEETYKANSAKIPNICRYFKIDVMNLQTFMTKENWVF